MHDAAATAGPAPPGERPPTAVGYAPLNVQGNPPPPGPPTLKRKRSRLCSAFRGKVMRLGANHSGLAPGYAHMCTHPTETTTPGRPP